MFLKEIKKGSILGRCDDCDSVHESGNEKLRWKEYGHVLCWIVRFKKLKGSNISGKILKNRKETNFSRLDMKYF